MKSIREALKTKRGRDRKKCHRFYKKTHGTFLISEKNSPLSSVTKADAFRGALAEPHPPLIATLGVFRVRANSPRSRLLRNEGQRSLQIRGSKKLQCIIIVISILTILFKLFKIRENYAI